MAEFNLLPQELAPKSSQTKFATGLAKINLAVAFLFLFAASAAIAIFFIMSTKLKESVGRQDRLLSAIEALSNTEQELFLVKDRLQKASGVLSANPTLSKLELIEEVTKNLPDGISVTEAQIKPDLADLDFDASSSSALVRFLAQTVANAKFSTVVMRSLSYSTGGGYHVSLSLAN